MDVAQDKEEPSAERSAGRPGLRQVGTGDPMLEIPVAIGAAAGRDVPHSVAMAASTVAADEDVRTPSVPDGKAKLESLPLGGIVSYKRRFLICTLVALAILVGYNLLIRRIARTSQRQQLMAALGCIPADTDCLFIGNSLVEAGLDTAAFQGSWPGGSIRSRNIALGATYPVEHYLILKKALSGKLNVKYIVYGFFDDELNVPPSGKWDELVGNRALSYYFPDEAAEIYAPGSALKKWELRVTSKLPMFSERSSLWGKVDVLREKFSGIGMPRRDRNRFGFVQNFGALEASDVDDFNRRCLAAEKGGFSIPVQKILQLAREHGATLVLVEMPMPSRHRQMFYSSEAWSKLRQRLQSMAADNHLRYISASDWVKTDAEFEDVTHLNEAGAKDFSAQLAKVLSSTQATAMR
jgi:hypothetical protein